MNYRKLLHIVAAAGLALAGTQLIAAESETGTPERKCVLTDEVRNLSTLGCKPPAPPAPPPVPAPPSPPPHVPPPAPPAPPSPPAPPEPPAPDF